MSNESGGLGDKLGLIAAAVLAVLAALWLIFDALHLEGIYQERAEDRAQEYADKAQKQIRSGCGEGTPAAQLDCVNQKREAAREGQRKEYDLEAQQHMAVWTRTMGLAAVIAMGVGMFGVWLIFTTFKETRRAAESADNTYKAFIKVERAILVISVRSFLSNAEGCQAELQASNIGKTHCTIESLAATWVDTEKWPADGFIMGKDVGQFVGEGQTERIRQPIRQKPFKHSIVRGHVRYRSPLGEHVTFFTAKFWRNNDPAKGWKWRTFTAENQPQDT